MFDWLTGLSRSAEERREERLSAYIDGALSSRQRQQLETELGQDANLRAELHDLQQTVKMLRSLPAMPPPRHFTLDPAVYGRVKPRRLYLYPVMRAATVLTSLLFVFLFVSDLFFATGQSPAPMAQESDWMEPSEVAVQEYTAAEEEVVEIEAGAAKEVAEAEIESEGVSEAEAPLAPPPATIVLEAEVVVEEGGADTQATAPAERAGENDVAVAEEVLEAGAPQEPLAATEQASVAVATEPAAVAAAPLPTAAPATEDEVGAAAGSQEPTPSSVAPSPMPLTTGPTSTPIPTPSTAPSPTLAEQILADEAAAEPTPAPEPSRAEPFDWWPLVRWGMGGLALALLAITLLARRFNW